MAAILVLHFGNSGRISLLVPLCAGWTPGIPGAELQRQQKQMPTATIPVTLILEYRADTIICRVRPAICRAEHRQAMMKKPVVSTSITFGQCAAKRAGIPSVNEFNPQYGFGLRVAMIGPNKGNAISAKTGYFFGPGDGVV